MDILEQHLEQQDVSTVHAKDDGGTGIVIEEAEIVDCEGEPVGEDGMRYQEALAYRVVQVNGATAGNEIELPVTQPGNNTVQVLTSPLNGQFYVIGNANDVFTTAQTSRSLVPRTTTLQIETPRNCTTVLKKRDDRRRATHNEVERRRRDKINNWITKLGKIIPECNAGANSTGSGSGEGKANYETQSKGGILSKACEYITELRAANQGLGQCLRDNEKLRQEITALKQVVTQLKRENLQLRSQMSPSTGTNVDVVHLSP
ncbi:upstream stimulatory factor 2-like isoform X1 [Bombus vosnesenskii]|uniref:Upstream stimulatory factor 2-like isoform X1 n=5 Tax=Pyrobombus TaxID=144703 RepID=A0A6J3KC78_9HYME|nr:upstream stimulatory factor 2 isoform X1 [Bombus impatiens]XP_033350682.1 upstream stimulatory factor 2-like isoform X1 [Bombus vosnesenskii]XP_050473884.1 upstream stimulatory factor 2-like isoform X1 [Bombus huntii]